MKTLTIGSTTLEITSYARRRDVQKGFYLELTIPKESIGMDNLYALLNNNAEPIVITEADGVENTYIGFKEIGSFALENGAYKVAQVCTSEIEAQLSLAQNKVNEQNAVIASLQNVVETKAEEVAVLSANVLAQAEQITAQTEQVATLEEMSVAQLSALDTILTEVVPSIIELAVAQAVEAVTTTNDTEPTEE
jgi:hypothetical protein